MGKKIKDMLWGTTTRKIWTIVIVRPCCVKHRHQDLSIQFRHLMSPYRVSRSFSNGPQWLTNSFLTTILVDILLLVIALIVRFSLKEVPSGVANFMEWVVESMYGLAESVAGKNAGQVLSLGHDDFSACHPVQLERADSGRWQHRRLSARESPRRTGPD